MLSDLRAVPKRRACSSTWAQGARGLPRAERVATSGLRFNLGRSPRRDTRTRECTKAHGNLFSSGAKGLEHCGEVAERHTHVLTIMVVGPARPLETGGVRVGALAPPLGSSDGPANDSAGRACSYTLRLRRRGLALQTRQVAYLQLRLLTHAVFETRRPIPSPVLVTTWWAKKWGRGYGCE
jgi:hypothetical protein